MKHLLYLALCFYTTTPEVSYQVCSLMLLSLLYANHTPPYHCNNQQVETDWQRFQHDRIRAESVRTGHTVT